MPFFLSLPFYQDQVAAGTILQQQPTKDTNDIKFLHLQFVTIPPAELAKQPLKGAFLVLVPKMVNDFIYQEAFIKLLEVVLPLVRMLAAFAEHSADNWISSSGLRDFDNLFVLTGGRDFGLRLEILNLFHIQTPKKFKIS